MSALPATMRATATLDSAADGSRMGVISSPTLHDLYFRTLRGQNREADWVDCAEVLADPTLTFTLWPDAKAHGLVLAPSSLPHAVQACGDTVTIPTKTLRQLGVAPALLNAIDAAH